MEDRPEGFDERLLARALESWGIGATSLTYAPVGFGDYHWEARGPDGGHWFVTVSDAGRKGVAGLRAAMDAAAALAERLDFVVAPLRAAGGATVVPAGDRYAVSVFPFVDGTAGRFGEELTASDRAAVIDLLAGLHAAEPPAPVAVRPLELSGRGALEEALRDTGPWRGGPYAEPARDLLLGRAAALLARLAEFDRGAGRVAARPVVTHGEPHPGNLLRARGRFLLVDWDTVGLAPPERDLWLVAEGPGDLARYAEAAGRAPDPALLELYRLRWQLDDVAEYAAWFRGPHGRTPDTEVAWASLEGTVGHLTS
ncbi:phosphotransferase [Nonomuraea pusilla]|uniref:Spectinomycin phosphotransferase n=1 Tax=Nonomuraea pusilla TaxID=46177 RepID=A0A1H7Z4L1_9ACTN|nr:phosphotransferase [Nonomuraea pusilla]SEM52488.1 spectinomycin phosphotransferase [Nonomuraea pusilla]